MDDSLAGVSVAVVTVSDSVSRQESEDRSGPEAVRLLESAGATIVLTTTVPDLRADISRVLRTAAANSEIDLVVTTGGTGVAQSDVTPEATEEVCNRMIPGIAELMRRTSVANTPFATLSRAVAGISGQTLIVNLPGSPGGVRDCLEVVLPLISHAVGLIRGEPTSHRQT